MPLIELVTSKRHTMEQKQKMSSTMGSDQVYFKEITPDMAFFNSLPSFTRFEYSKQLPAGGPSCNLPLELSYQPYERMENQPQQSTVM